MYPWSWCVIRNIGIFLLSSPAQSSDQRSHESSPIWMFLGKKTDRVLSKQEPCGLSCNVCKRDWARFANDFGKRHYEKKHSDEREARGKVRILERSLDVVPTCPLKRHSNGKLRSNISPEPSRLSGTTKDLDEPTHKGMKLVFGCGC
jgi:hypothetical protein